MINKEEVWNIVENYDLNNIHIGTLGSHSALDILDGAKDEGFKTIIVCQKGREKTYLKYYKRLINEYILLDKFSMMINDDIQNLLRNKNTIFIPHRAFSTYITYEDIENNFLIPIFGNRYMLRTEERNFEKNQYYLLERAGIRQPKKFKSPSEIDRLVIVKVQEAKRKIERAFFTAVSEEDFWKKANKRIEEGVIRREDLEKAVIEEFVIGTYFNFNFFYSPLKNELEFMGIDRRLQTNLHDFISLPAKQQLEIDIILQNIEIGHMGATIRESMLEKVFEIGEKFVEITKREFPPGIIGPFALQGAVTKDQEIVIFDVSPRMPGSPVIGTTSPYTKYAYGIQMSMGRRIAREIKEAIETGRIKELIT